MPPRSLEVRWIAVCLAALCACGPLDPGDDPHAIGGKADGPPVVLEQPHHLWLRSTVVWEKIEQSWREARFGAASQVTTVTVINALAEPGGDGRLTVKLCSVWLPRSTGGYQPYLGARTVASIPPLELTLSAGPRGLQSTMAEVSLGMAQDDADDDGQPGITIRIQGHDDWEIHAGVRISLGLESGVDSEGAVGLGGTTRGTFDFELDQQIYGDTIAGWFFSAKASLKRFAYGHQLVSRSNRYSLAPLAEGVDCQDVPQL